MHHSLQVLVKDITDFGGYVYFENVFPKTVDISPMNTISWIGYAT